MRRTQRCLILLVILSCLVMIVLLLDAFSVVKKGRHRGELSRDEVTARQLVLAATRWRREPNLSDTFSDAWGNPITVTNVGESTIARSMGMDGKWGTGDDVKIDLGVIRKGQ